MKTSLSYMELYLNSICVVVEAAMTELRRLVREHLSDELKKLRVSVEGQIKESEKIISKKLEAAEATSQTTTTVAATVKGPKDKKK